MLSSYIRVRNTLVGVAVPAAATVLGLALLSPATARADFGPFNRYEAVQAAIKWLDSPYTFPNDCTFYVSQALWDGGLKPTPDWTPRTSDESKLAARNLYNPGPSKAAASADHFKNYMVNSGTATIKEIKWSDNTAGGAELADVIAYDWDSGADGRVDHLAIVTSINSDHYPSVSQHSPTRRDRYWSWDTGADNWIEFSHPGARVYLIHIK
jgi:hypothetical protein